MPDSLKKSTREKRGKGVCRKVSGETNIISNWIDFLHEPNNKKELFVFLTGKVSEFQTKLHLEFVVSLGYSIPVTLNCNHEEADTRFSYCMRWSRD